MNNFVQVHSKSEGYDGGLQQEFCQALALNVKGVTQRESVNQSSQKRDGRRDQPTRRQNQAQKEDVLAHDIESDGETERTSKQ